MVSPIPEFQDELLELHETLDRKDRRILKLEQTKQQQKEEQGSTKLAHYSLKKYEIDRRALLSEEENDRLHKDKNQLQHVRYY